MRQPPSLEELNARYAVSQATREAVGWEIAKAVAVLTNTRPGDVFAGRFPRSSFLKAATPPLSTGDLDPAHATGRLVVQAARPRTVIGQLPATLPVPPATRVLPLLTGPVASFVTEGEPTPAAALDFAAAAIIVAQGKIGLILPVTNELLRSPDANVPVVVQRAMVRAIALAEDTALLDGGAAVPGGRPASIIHGLTPVASIEALFPAVRGGLAESPVFITSQATALALAAQRDAVGPIYPNVGAAGGDILGIPLIISAPALNKVILLDSATLLVSDGGAEIALASQSSLQLQSAPAVNPQPLVSLWQSNLSAFRLLRYIGWQLAAADGAAFTVLA